MTNVAQAKYDIELPSPWEPKQALLVHTRKKRVAAKQGRRSGKTVGLAVRHAVRFMQGKRILYASHTSDQIGRYWATVTRIFARPIEDGVLYCNNSERIIEVPGTEVRIKAKSAWDADTLRGDYADELALDEHQLMHESAWDEVGQPMMLDTNGDAVFLFTPPSINDIGKSKARDPMHVIRLWRRAKVDPLWEAISATSLENPHLSKQALELIASGMTALAYRQEILAEDIDEAPGAMWNRQVLEKTRVANKPDELDVIVVAVDPTATSTGDEAGIIVAGRKNRDYYVWQDESQQGSPQQWAQAAVNAYQDNEADYIVAESNNGGEMVAEVIKQVDPNVPVHLVHASRGKQTRAQPAAALYEQGRAHHVGSLPKAEDEMCLWQPGNPSPNRMDALVWALADLINAEIKQRSVQTIRR